MSDIEGIVSALEDYPRTIKLDGGGEVELTPARLAHRDAIVAFAQNLDEQDVLFLRVDITQPASVDNWLKNVAAGETVSILARTGDTVVGYGTVDRNSARWTRRVGEIRVNVAADYRGKGLGRHLTAGIFDIARGLGLRKITANMTPDQAGAQAAFARLGFRPEALLADHVEDHNGGIHDLLILSYDIDGLSSQMNTPLKI